jgi:uncharacterized protein YaaQ
VGDPDGAVVADGTGRDPSVGGQMKGRAKSSTSAAALSSTASATSPSTIRLPIRCAGCTGRRPRRRRNSLDSTAVVHGAGVDGWPSVAPLRHNRRPRLSPCPMNEGAARPMKLITAIVHNEDASTLVDALLEKEYRATRFNSSGGFLKQGNATILVGVEDDQVDAVLELISANCHSRKQFVNPMPPIMEPGEFYMPYPVEVEVGGATVFVLPVERFERL